MPLTVTVIDLFCLGELFFPITLIKDKFYKLEIIKSPKKMLV